MSKTHFNNNRSYVEAFLGKALHEGQLALFLGSGVSRELFTKGRTKFGLPTWGQLVKGLYDDSKVIAPNGTNFLQQVEDFKNLYEKKGGSLEQFHALVQKILYQKIVLDFSVIRKHATLAGIGALLAHSRRGTVRQLFTLNFDDVVERYLRYHGILATPVIEERFWSLPADILVHHPHGFLPSPGSPFKRKSSFLVFDEESYIMQNAESRWNQCMEVAMQSHFCLFIGLGRDDFHLKQLVSRSSKKHAFSINRDGYWGVVLQANPKQAEVMEWQKYDVHVERLTNYHTDLPSVLFGICQKAAELSGN